MAVRFAALLIVTLYASTIAVIVVLTGIPCPDMVIPTLKADVLLRLRLAEYWVVVPITFTVDCADERSPLGRLSPVLARTVICCPVSKVEFVHTSAVDGDAVNCLMIFMNS